MKVVALCPELTPTIVARNTGGGGQAPTRDHIQYTALVVAQVPLAGDAGTVLNQSTVTQVPL